MQTLLLLAGRSKRLWPLEDKTLWPVAGKPLLLRQVESLRRAGCGDITLVGGSHNIAQARSLLPDCAIVEQEDLDLGMQGALLSALPVMRDGPVLVVSSNDVIEESAYAALREAAERDTETQGWILAKKTERYFPGGYVTLDGDRVTGIVEKPGEGNEPSDLVTIVAHVHRSAPLLLEALRAVESDRDDGYEQALAALFTAHAYRVFPYEGSWHAVKYPWHFLPLLSSLLSRITEPSIAPSASVHPTAVIEGPVTLEEGVKVMAHATVVGPCTIGKHTVIANNALVRQSSVGDHCVIGYATEVARSLLHDHVWTHSSYIGDSVIGENVSFGAGTITANLRLDEEPIRSVVNEEPLSTDLVKCGAIIGSNCRTGVRVTLLPGIKVGTGSFIASDTSVSRDIPERSYVLMKQGECEVRENKAEVPHPGKRKEFRDSAGIGGNVEEK